MLLSGHAHTVAPGEGQTVDLGIIQMRVLAAGRKATARRAFTLAEFTGGEGPWTVPHIHHAMEESFYVLDGQYVFTVGEQEIPAGPGSYVLVPRGSRHAISRRRGGRPASDAHGPGWPGGDVPSNSEPCHRAASPTRPCGLRSPPDTTRAPPSPKPFRTSWR